MSWLVATDLHGLDLRQVASRRLAQSKRSLARFPQRSANHTLRVGMRERPGVPCHLVRNYNRAAHNNRARPRPRVIYPSHPESDRANGPPDRNDGDAGARGSGTRFCFSLAPRLSLSLSLSLYLSPANPGFEATRILYHPTAVAELRGETAHRRCRVPRLPRLPRHR